MRFLGTAIILILFFAYLFFWFQGNEAWLFDRSVQNEDASLFLAPFHWLSAGGSQDLPLFVKENRFLIPPAFELLYRGLLFWVDLSIASKIVQGFCLFIITVSGLVLWRSSSPRNFPIGLFLVFMMFHSSFVVNRMGGGVPRSFCFPVLALWGAGKLTQNNKVVLVATVLGALFYPPAVIMVLVSETLFLFCHKGLKQQESPFRARARSWFFLGLVATVCLAPFLFRAYQAGPVVSISEAQKNHAFYFRPLGKEGLFPLSNLGAKVGYFFSLPFTPFQSQLFSTRSGSIDWKRDSTYALILFVLLIFLAYTRLSQIPRLSLVFLIGVLACYSFSLILGLHLNWPDTYFHYGVFFSAVLFSAEILKGLKTGVLGNQVIICFFVFLVLLFTGTGIVPDNGMNMKKERFSSLYSKTSLLPPDSLIAGHPFDADGIPYWAGRAVVVSAKTIQPLLTDVWKAQKSRTLDLLVALYAKNPIEIVDFSDHFGVTHFLIREDRYGPNFLERLQLIEPFSSYMTMRLASFTHASPVWENVPLDAIEFRENGFMMVSVQKLKDAWVYTPSKSL